jgi:hypothetical protein
MVEFLLCKQEKKIKDEKDAIGYQQRTSGLEVKTAGCVMYQCDSNPTEVSS